MRRTALSLALASALAITVGVAAQSDPTMQREKAQSSSKTVTLTGCLASDTSGTAGTSGTSGSAGMSGNTFMLTNVEWKDKDMSGSSRGTSGQGMEGHSGMQHDKNMRVQLIASDPTTNLREHIGKKVEVTGMMMPKSESGRGAEGTSGTEQERGMSGSSSKDMMRLRVNSVRQIAETCR